MSFCSGQLTCTWGKLFNHNIAVSSQRYYIKHVIISVCLSVFIGSNLFQNCQTRVRTSAGCINGPHRPHATCKLVCLPLFSLIQNNHILQVVVVVLFFNDHIPLHSSRDLKVECHCFPFISDRPAYSGPTGRTFMLPYGPVMRP